MADDLELARFEHAPVVIAEDRDQHRVSQPRLGRLPLDVEIRREVTRWPVFEHIDPPPVGRRGDRHVIRHDVEDLSQPCALQRRGESPEPFLAAELHIRSRVVDHVVAVGAAWCGLQIGRAIHVRDAQFRQVVADPPHHRR